MKKVLILFLLSIFASSAFASSSASFNITPEVFGGGGGDMSSSHYAVHGKIRGTAYGIRSSADYRIGEGFLNASFNALNLTPVISSISPSSGNNTGPVSVTINGANFQTGAVASLEKTLQTDISAESLTVVNSGKITCSFNLTNKVIGQWDVVVLDPDGTSGTLAGGFTIVVPSSKLEVVGRPVNFPNPFDPEKASTTIKYTLSRDASIVLNIYDINGERIWQRTFVPGENGGKAGVNLIPWDGYTAFSQLVPNGVYVFQIASGGETLATGKIAVFR